MIKRVSDYLYLNTQWWRDNNTYYKENIDDNYTKKECTDLPLAFVRKSIVYIRMTFIKNNHKECWFYKYKVIQAKRLNLFCLYENHYAKKRK